MGCSVGRSVCSICGAESGGCEHEKGQTLRRKALLYWELREATDAYEWSFVAVPAQQAAGVVKGSPRRTELRRLRLRQAELGRRYRTALRREVVRLACWPDGLWMEQVLHQGHCGEAGMRRSCWRLKRAYEAPGREANFPWRPQLRQQAETKRRAMKRCSLSDGDKHRV